MLLSTQSQLICSSHFCVSCTQSDEISVFLRLQSFFFGFANAPISVLALLTKPTSNNQEIKQKSYNEYPVSVCLCRETCVNARQLKNVFVQKWHIQKHIDKFHRFDNAILWIAIRTQRQHQTWNATNKTKGIESFKLSVNCCDAKKCAPCILFH